MYNLGVIQQKTKFIFLIPLQACGALCSTFSELLDALAAQHIQCSVILSCWLNHGIIETVNKIKHYCTFLFREIKIKMEGGLGHAFRSKIRDLRSKI